MRRRNLTIVIVVGFALAIVGALAPSFYHVTCTPVPEGSGLETPCVETVPAALVLALLVAGVAGGIAAVVALARIRRSPA